MKIIRHQQGYSLLELLLGLILSTMLMAGVIEIFSSMSQGNSIRNALSRIQEDGRFAIEILSRELRHTGFRMYKIPIDDIAFSFKSLSNPFGDSVNIPESARIFGVNGLPDKFYIRYQAGSAQDLQESLCFGGNTAASGLSPAISNYKTSSPVITEKFYIENNALKCDSRLDYNPTAAGYSNTKSKNAYTLIENVETMRVLYGENTYVPASGEENDPPNEYYVPNKYVDAATVSDWEQIRSVRISLLIRSENSSITDSDTATIKINGNKSISIDSADKNRLYRDFSTTVMLRNMILFPTTG